ncbi:DUF4377 domain-containing protein [Aliidiomarina soli]|uniref:DUF4377 domain-containing protein n=1 Tax=Aliidiomarina soli TaxID=1928574 RepID=A0A432WH04_9GAMM|nr:DUF4377 domain-containing protein [Aliidiomarina soli]RUO33054.1 hypothetical protein CWE14_07390 [Aliidiomarina soli]
MLKPQLSLILKVSSLTLAVLLTGCNSSDEKGDTYTREVVVIDGQPAIFNGAFFTSLGYSIERESGQQTTAPWIEDFTFRWGYQVTARIEVVTYAEPPEDGPMHEYRLLEILDSSEDEVGTVYSFDGVFLRNDNTFQIDEDNEGYYLFLDESFVCAQNINCDQLVDMSNDGGTISLEFEYLGQSDDRPTAVMLTDWN